MKIKLLCFSFCLFCCAQLWAKDYDISEFGAKADGITVNTKAIQRAIDFVHEKGGGRLVFSAGRYVSGSIHLKSNVTLHIESGSVLLGSTNPLDYDMKIYTAFVFAYNQNNVGITGKGLIDCRGRQVAYNLVDLIHRGIVKDQLGSDRPWEAIRPMIINFRECTNVLIEDISLTNSGSWVQTYDQCKGLKINRIHVQSNAYWNNDGLDVVDCENTTVTNSFFDSSDDAICLKSHDPNAMCKNILIRNNVARSGASGIKFGTVSRGGFVDIKIHNNKVYDTYRSAITIGDVDGAVVENIDVDTLQAINTGNVIYLRIADRWSEGKKASMKNVTISNVYAEVPAGKPDKGYDYEGPIHDLPRNVSPASFVGLSDNLIDGVKLKNITIVYPGGGNPYYAKVGTTPEELAKIPEMRGNYPEFSQFKELPAWAFYVRHAKNVSFENVKLIAEKPDYRPAIVLDDAHNVSFKQVTYTEPDAGKKKQMVSNKSTDVAVK